MLPVLFTLPVVGAVHSYAVLVTLAYAGAAVIGVRAGVRAGRDVYDMLELGLVVVLAAILGSKLFHVVFEAKGHHLLDGRIATGVGDLLRDDPWHWARLLEPGYVFVGGVVGGVSLGYAFARRRGFPQPLGLGDAAAPGLLFGIAVGRVGCFLAGCCYGGPVDVDALAWAGVHFPASHPSHGALVWPVQLVDAGFGVVGLIAWWRLQARARFAGEAFLVVVMAYCFERVASELLRGDADRGVWLMGLSTSQAICIAALPVCLIVHRVQMRERRRTAAAGSSS